MGKFAKYVIAIVVLVAVLFVASAILGSAINPDPTPVVFYDETVESVNGVAPEGASLWMLQDGFYDVTYTDGSTAKIAVNNGSWSVEYVNPAEDMAYLQGIPSDKTVN